MKFVVVFAAVLAVSSAQFNPYTTVRPGQYQPYQPNRFSTPLPSPVPSPLPIRPSAIPPVNRVSTNDAAANIISYVNDASPDGSFGYAYQTDNGISVEAQGTPRDFGGNPPVVPVIITGRYSFTAPDGQPIVITYTADENGFQAQGDAIPTPHPIPEYILRALDHIAKNPPAPQKK